VISEDELDGILERHARWLRSGGSDGKCADFSDRDLKGNDLRGKLLQKAVLRRANLAGAEFDSADLRKADLSEAELSRTRLHGARLKGAVLRYADLSSVLGLLPGQLGGCDLTGAALPPSVADLPLGKALEAEIEWLRGLFLLMMTATLYSVLTLLSTDDVALLTRSSSLVFPGVSTPIPTIVFFVVGPPVLLGIYVHFHMHVNSLWADLEVFPKITPDGLETRRNLTPWLVFNGAVALFAGAPGTSRLWRWNAYVQFGAAWLLVPLVQFFFWWNYLSRHDWSRTFYLLAIAIANLVLAWAFLRKTRTVLAEPPSGVAIDNPASRVVVGTVAIVGLFCVSFGAIEEGFRKADFNRAEVSKKPAGWKTKDEDLPQVIGAELNYARLEWLQGERAFLVNAELKGAKLKHAHLHQADLRRALLDDADLTEAKLPDAALQLAQMSRAVLSKAELDRADLSGALLLSARFDGAVLSDTRLRGVKATGCSFLGAVLIDTDFSPLDGVNSGLVGAKFSGAELTRVKFERAALVNADFRGVKKIDQVDFLNAELGQADFSGVDLTTALNLTADQIKSALKDNQTKWPTSLLTKPKDIEQNVY
jgi:uncharacterized protein YjbI with pentapeptide repeats